jgi:hypothetical protein
VTAQVVTARVRRDFSFGDRFFFVSSEAAVRSAEGEAATMIILICAGWVPHEHDPSGAASV